MVCAVLVQNPRGGKTCVFWARKFIIIFFSNKSSSSLGTGADFPFWHINWTGSGKFKSLCPSLFKAASSKKHAVVELGKRIGGV